MRFAGVDTHKKYSTIVLTDGSGKRLARASLPNEVTSFRKFFGNSSEPTTAVLEAGRTWGVIYDLLAILVRPIAAGR